MCGEKYFAITISNLWVVSVLFGLYVALFGGSIYVLVYRQPNAYHMGVSIALFLLITSYMGITLATVLTEPSITSSSSIVDGSTLVPCISGSSERLHEALTFYPLNIAMAVTTTCMCVIADGVLIYRCVVLWPRRLGQWIGVFLGVLLLAETGVWKSRNLESTMLKWPPTMLTAVGLVESYYIAQVYYLEKQISVSNETTPPPRWFEMANNLSKFGTANNYLELAVNVLATILIASRIWYLAHQLEKTLGQGLTVRYRAAISIIVESGSLITASQIVMTCIDVVNSVQIYGNLISDISIMLLVIAPTLIIVRVGMGKGFDDVVETANQHHASEGVRETQIRSIRFAEHRTTTTDASHLASLGAIISNAGPESDSDARSADSGSEQSNVLGRAEETKVEKEVNLSMV
ncbi:hypothetical protein EVG20_g5468 [Dentipellis fragilis]|uniref:Uncharacterized protein n=1 Tax=Dentipellis fragilis TaxID=205917 RepID=A0A4Y9YVL2_9AGAM|nr:hypothetical protein EVG20_g5468 [Dentipellis fragilis]